MVGAGGIVNGRWGGRDSECGELTSGESRIERVAVNWKLGGGEWSAGSSLKNRSISRRVNTDGEGKKENKAKVTESNKCICRSFTTISIVKCYAKLVFSTSF